MATPGTPSTLNYEPAWDIFEIALKTMPHSFRMWLPTYLSGMAPLGHQLQHYTRQNSQCQHCGEPETTQHLALCQSPSVLNIWNQTKHRIIEWLRQKNTYDQLQTQLEMALNTYSQHLTVPPYHIDQENTAAHAYHICYMASSPNNGSITSKDTTWPTIAETREKDGLFNWPNT